MDNRLIYKIDHYYNIDHNAQSRFVKIDMDFDTFYKTLSAIHFKFEHEIDMSLSFEEKHFVEILERFYEAEDVTEECQKYLPYTKLNKEDWNVLNFFNMPDNTQIVMVDLYLAREICCGKCNEIMMKYLPENPEFEEMVKSFKEFY